MNTFLVHVGDDNFYRLLPEEMDRSKSKAGRVKVMAFPRLEIQKLAPVLRQPSAVVNRLRAKGYGLLLLHRIFRRPIRTWKLLRAFSRPMKMSDIVKLL